MKLTHETLVRGNPAQILLPRFTVSQIMRNDQQVSFRIFFTANYNTFSKDDYMVVKYAEPDADGMPKADKKGFVRYFRPLDGNKPNFGNGGDDDSLVFGRLVYLPQTKSYSIDWTDSVISREIEPADMLLEESLEMRKPRKHRRRRKPKTESDRRLEGITPTEQALAAQTMDSKAKDKQKTEEKTKEYREAESRAMNTTMPSVNSFNESKMLAVREEGELYASRMEIQPETPLGSIATYSSLMSMTMNQSSQSKEKDKSYGLSLDGQILGFKYVSFNEDAEVEHLIAHAKYDDSADDISYGYATRAKIEQYAGDNPAPGLRFAYAKQIAGRRYNFLSSDEFISELSSKSGSFMQTSMSPNSFVVCDGKERGGRGLRPFTGKEIKLETDNMTRDDYHRFVAAYSQHCLASAFNVPVQSTNYKKEAERLVINISDSSSSFDPGWVDSSNPYLGEGGSDEDEPGIDNEEEEGGGIKPPHESIILRQSKLQKNYTAEDETTDDVGGADNSSEGNPPQTNHEPIPGPPDPDTPSILNPPGSNPQPPPNPDETTEERPPPNPPDSNTPDAPPSVPPNNEDMGGDPSPPPQQNPDENAPPDPNTPAPDPPSPPAPNPPAPAPAPNPPSSSSNGPRKRQHLRPFKSHYQPGYDPVTGDLVWKVKLGFDGHFDTFEDYVRFFTESICKRAQEEAYMASGGRTLPDNAEIIDALAMLAQKRLYFRSNPGYVYCYWEHCSPRLRRMFQSPYYFRDHYSRHLYWYLKCGTANCTELKDDTYKILIGRCPFINRGQEVVVNSYTPITIPGNSFFNPMWIEVRDENDELYELQIPYIIEWSFTPFTAEVSTPPPGSLSCAT
ncbi:Hypothetical protein DHA2_150967 [Giardia duodenalis]|uniref:Uncharacterized protein n=1 Tax=Giardia intestinalis TaxID=5741 RepID=V6TA36_GIAIN|nr:Hypothetical protein DHA2_150967 [Giardia intestinalis]